MFARQRPSRRGFLSTALKSGVAGAVATLGALPTFGQQPAAPRNVRVGTKSVIGPEDLIWLGAWKTPPSFNGTYSRPSLGLRYVNAERRFLFHEWGGAAGLPGDIVEMKAPASSGFYAGPDMAGAPAMIETRRWAAADWAPSWYNGTTYVQGAELGDLYWDEASGLLWFTLYGPYAAGVNTPVWGAVELRDAVKSGLYRTVGTKYGPWSYVSTNQTGAPVTYARMVNQWIVPIPPGGQSLVNGAKFLIGAGHTGFNGDAPWGPNLHVLADLTPEMSNPVPMVKQLAEYGPLSPLVARNLRRDGTRYFATEPGGSADKVNGEGVWYGGNSAVKAIVWVETAAKHGVVMFGAEAQGGVGYWHANPKGDDPYAALVDPTLPLGPGNGPKATEHYLWLRVLNPAHFAEVYAGTRCPYAATYAGKPGMRLAYEGDMRATIRNGSNIPLFYNRWGDATQARVSGPDTDFNGAEWDAVTNQIIWMQYGAAPSASVLSFFAVS